ncbi:uncharacterized protein [Mytilus edulis]|uniref:uncharacterized protein n=1 Tax=Mytilus edulis TaxID=6550 RepID=UPI0039EEAA62
MMDRNMISKIFWTLCFISAVQAIPVRKRDLNVEDDQLIHSDLQDNISLLDLENDMYNAEILQQYLETIDTLHIENDILSGLLNDQLSRNTKQTRRSRKRNQRMDRNRRSFDSISHSTGGFSTAQLTENPTLRRLRELAALHQRRVLTSTNRPQLPNGLEVLYPILHQGQR